MDDKVILDTEEMVTITKKEYQRLLKRSMELRLLEYNGVDNWSGYSEEGLPDDEEEDEIS